MRTGGHFTALFALQSRAVAASVQEKVDGSLIKFWYDNGWHISTNGTIDAFKANLNNVKYQNFGQLVLAAIHNVFTDEHDFFNMLDPKCTYMFELVSPYNRVVIPYEETKLYFLGMRERNTGMEWNPEELDESFYFQIPKSRRSPNHQSQNVILYILLKMYRKQQTHCLGMKKVMQFVMLILIESKSRVHLM